MFPDDGPFRRELYRKHCMFFAAGGQHEPMPTCPEGCDGRPHRERCFMAGNRCGKTEAGAYEMTLHLTGLYPHWWTGKRFDRGIKAWAASDTNKTLREVLQEKMLGRVGEYGTGMIPGDLIRKATTKQGLSDAIDNIYVRHVSGQTSVLTLKSYQEGRESFQGSAMEVIWLDEESPESIYTECVLRTMTTGGVVYLTFTPLQGLSEVVLSFMPGGQLPGTTTEAA